MRERIAKFLSRLRNPGNSEALWRAAMLGATLLFVINGTMMVTRLSDLGSQAKQISSAHFSLKLLGDLLSAAQDQEISIRGYLITQNPRFLEPKKRADEVLPVLRAELRRLASNDTVQAHRLSSLESIINSHIAHTNRVLDVAKTQSVAAALALEKEGAGKVMMDQIRVELMSMEVAEAELLRDRLQAFEESRERGRIAAAVMLLTMLSVLFLTLFVDHTFKIVRASVSREAASRHAAEQALESSELRLRTALMHLPLRLYSVDCEGRYTWLHDPLGILTSFDIIGKRDDELFARAEVKELLEAQQEAIQSRQVIRRTLQLPFSGRAAYYDVTLNPEHDDEGKIVGLTISAFDIQRQIELQHAMEQTAQDFQVIADAMPQIVWGTDAHGIPQYFNERWYEYTGADRGAPLASFQGKYIHPDDYASVVEKWSRSVKTGEPFETESRYRQGVTGDYRWFMVRGLPIRDERGEITRWFGTCTDIHAQKSLSDERQHFLESERAARKEFEHVMAGKEAYIATVTHELRGPLNSIIGWTQLLKSKGERVELQLVTRAVEIIERNARGQAQLVADLLEMERINAGKLVLEMSSVNLSRLIESAADSITPILNEKGITLVRDIDPMVRGIKGDARRLTQVVMNLLNNSLKFTPSGGTIYLSLHQEHDDVLIEVKDTGSGIDPKMLPLIFDRYNQGTAARKTEDRGLGLGLSIARNIVQLHGGRIVAFSDGIGKGARFRMYFPSDHESVAQSAVAREKPANRSLIAALQGVRILLVEDQDDSRDALSRILAAQGAQVDPVGSAREGLAALERQIPDMIISDISMPDMDGYVFIKEVRRKYSNVRAIALTAFTRDEDRKRAFNAGFDRHLGKPLDAALLLESIQQLLPTIHPT